MYVNITPLINYVHLGYASFHLGNVCQERVKQHEWHVSHHYTRLTEMLNGGRLPSKLHVLGHDGDALGVNGAQVGILEQSNKVSFRSLLEGKYSRALETQVVLDIFSTPLVPNVGMAPCESKGLPTFGTSGSLEAVIERNVQVIF